MPTLRSMLGSAAAQTFIVGRIRGTLSDGPQDDELTAMLDGSATGRRIHQMPFPDDWPLPSFGFARYGGGDVGPVGGPVAAQNLLYQVGAIIAGFDDTPILGPANVMNTLLDGRSAIVDVSVEVSPGNTVNGTFSVECVRESEFLTDLPPEEDGSVYQRQGGVYAFFVSRLG
jgi:hypothetical protein